jgi:hypothetical protein
MESYVYYHKNRDEIVYVGMGTGARCLSTYQRNDNHKEFISRSIAESGLKFVELPWVGLDPKEARRIEAREIRRLKPIYNQQMNGACNAGKGSKNRNARFTDSEVRNLRDKYKYFFGSLRGFHRSYAYHVSYRTLFKLLNGTSYRDVK